MEAVWVDPATDARLKKRIVRTLIHEVIADLEPQAGEIVIALHWADGVHTELRLPRRRRGRTKSTSVEIVEAVRLLVRIASDDVIAGLLNRNSLKTGYGSRWTRERVTSSRSHQKIPVYSQQVRQSEVFAGGGKRLAAQKMTAGMIGDGQPIAVLTIAQQELALVVRAPQLIGKLAER